MSRMCILLQNQDITETTLLTYNSSTIRAKHFATTRYFLYVKILSFPFTVWVVGDTASCDKNTNRQETLLNSECEILQVK